ncbi:MAG: AAA family ATPase [Pseudoxanthomonas sp.]
MPDLHQQVKTWLLEQKDWLQLAADLGISKQWKLDDADINTIAERLKTDEGQQVTKERTFDNLGADPGGNPIRLKSVGEIIGIENLAPRTPLEFGSGNLCVIYGNNGSGKSGYTRLLKKAAGKPGAKELKPNAFKPTPAERKCKITFHDGADQSVDWPANSDAISALNAVDIFDSDVASNYLKETESSYAPPLVSLFERLVAVVGKVKEYLQREQAALVKALPAIPAEHLQTKAGAQYNGLRLNSNPAEVQAIQSWSPEEEQDLANLNERLNAADPAALARQKRATKGQVEQLANNIKNAAVAYTAEKLQDVRNKRQDALTKRQISEQAGQVASAKLEGIGSETWKAMWEAARRYSQYAYHQDVFPVVADDARCVLCHQELTDEAKHRLQDFEAFVQGDVEAAAIAAQKSYEDALASLPLAPEEAALAQACQAAGLIDEVLIGSIKTFWRNITASRGIVQADAELNVAIPVAAPPDVVAELDVRIAEITAQAAQHDQDAANFNRADATQKKKELEAKKWAAQQAAAITAEMARLKKVAEFDEWLKSTNTGPITTKGGQVAEAAITEAYISRFNNELKKLGATKIKVKLIKTRADKGRTFHAIQLEGAAVKPEEILSEGERRIISLAAFLSDVAEKPNASAFIFDDPISSLDQDFELAVAKRLVELAKDRQVLVFTHRLSLYVALESEAKKMGDDWKKQHHNSKWIESFAGTAGQTAEESARSVNTSKANNILLAKVGDAKRKGEQEGADAYRDLASGLCSEIRILLERTVENDLLNAIVIRYRNSVTTDKKLADLTKITMDDCRFIDELMTKYSTLVHSQSTENPIDLPGHEELSGDLQRLKDWRDGFGKRQAQGVANA